MGNVTSTTDANGHTTTYAYDADDRLISVTDPLGFVTTTAYDPVGNVTSTTDANGHTTTYAYDADDRQISVTDPLGFVTTTAYDPVGNVTSTTDANGHKTTYAYDADDRLVSVTDPHHAGRPWLREPLRERRARLEALCAEVPLAEVIFSTGVVGAGRAWFEAAVAQGHEGIMAKFLGSPYQSGRRSTAWRKIKPPTGKSPSRRRSRAGQGR